MSNKEFIELFIEIGFTLYKESSTIIGENKEYKYYPDYLEHNRHYTLVIFKSNNFMVKLNEKNNSTSFRLYIHRTVVDYSVEGTFVSSPFQIDTYTKSNVERLTNKINEIFSAELRDIKLNKILL